MIDKYLLASVNNPTPRSKLFSYRFYDPVNHLYHMEDQVVGFILSCNPIVGCSEQLYKQLALLFDDQLPLGGVLEVLLVASDDLKEPLTKWKNGITENEAVYQKIHEYRSDFFDNYNRNASDNFRIRDYKLYFSYSQKLGKACHQEHIIDFRERLISILAAINIPSTELKADGLINLVGELAGYPNYGTKAYRECDLISDQLIDFCNPLLVEPEGILLDNGNYIIRCYEVDGYPKDFAIDKLPDLLGDSLQDNMQIPSRFAIVYTISNEISMNIQEGYKQKGEIILKQAASFLGAFNRSIEEEALEWNEIISRNLKSKEKFLRTSLSVMLLSQADKINKAEQNLISLWRKSDFILKPYKYFQLPALLSFCPFLNNSSLKKLQYSFGIKKTVMSSEPKALLPIHAEWKGSAGGGMVMSGRRGQLFTWDSFEGGSNYNVCVTGVSGSGKSVFLQEYIMSQLAKGARVFVVDIGRSFEKTCKIMDGDFVCFDTKSEISLNPFRNIKDEAIATDSLSMLKLIIAKMAAPIAGTSDIQNSIIAKAIAEVWGQYKNEADIDKLAEELKKHGEKGEDLALMLFEYTTKGGYGKFFNGTDNISFNKSFTVLEFEELRERPDLGGVIMQMLAIQIVQQVYLGDRSKRFIILFDEGWYALKQFPDLLASMARTVRKYNGSLVVGTQSLNDFYGVQDKDRTSRMGVIENCAWKIFLKQKSDSLEKANEIGISSSQVSVIKSLDTVNGKYSEAMIAKSDTEYFVARLMLDKFSQVLYSSSPKVFKTVNKYIEKGFSTVSAIEKVMRKI